MEGTLDLVTIDAQQQRDKDDAEQPGILDEQSAGHSKEVLVERGLQQGPDGGEGHRRRRHDDAGTLLQELLGMEALRHQAESKQVEKDGNDDIEHNHHEQPDDDGAVPVALPVARLVFFLDGANHCLPMALDVAEHGDIVLATVTEDAGLYLLVTLVGIVVQVLQPLLGHLVQVDVVGHLTAVLRQRVANVCGKGETDTPVLFIFYFLIRFKYFNILFYIKPNNYFFFVFSSSYLGIRHSNIPKVPSIICFIYILETNKKFGNFLFIGA